MYMRKLRYALFLACAGVLFGSGPATANMIGIAFNGNVFYMDPVAGSQTLLGNAGLTRMDSLATSPSGVLYSVGGATDDQLVTINPATGLATTVATLNYGDPKPTGTITGLSFSPSGDLFGINGATKDLYRINQTTGATTLIGNTGITATIGDLAFSPSGLLYAWTLTFGLHTIDPTTGLATAGTGNPGGVNFLNMAFSPDGTLWTLGSPSPFNRFSTVDLLTGDLTPVSPAPLPLSIRGLQPVPVPAAVWLFGTGLVALAGLARRSLKPCA